MLTSIAPAVSQGTAGADVEEWVCNVRDPNAADPDFVFETTVQANNADSSITVSHPNKSRTGPARISLRYLMVLNDKNGINGIDKIQDGPTPQGYGVEILLINKADGSFRAGGMLIGGFYTSTMGTCKRK